MKEIELPEKDELFDAAARLVVSNQSGSTSLIQRYLKLGYNRACKIMQQLASASIVGAYNGASPRNVLVKNLEQLEKILPTIYESALTKPDITGGGEKEVCKHCGSQYLETDSKKTQCRNCYKWWKVKI